MANSLDIQLQQPVSNKVISYVMFKLKNFGGDNPQGREPSVVNLSKYFRNLPALIVCNSEFYRDFQMHIMFSHEMTDHPIYELLRVIESRLPNFRVNLVSNPTVSFEPSIWRMYFVFDQSKDVVLIRDIDSIPNTREVRAVRVFEDLDRTIHSIRAHPAHANPDCKLLAGLCGFKPSKLSVGDFDTYYSSRQDSGWGCDQALLNRVFVYERDDAFVYANLLDSPIHYLGTVERNTTYKPFFVDDDVYAQKDLGINTSVCELADKMSPWAGCNDVDVRVGKPFFQLMKLNIETARIVKDVIVSNKYWKAFFKL